MRLMWRIGFKDVSLLKKKHFFQKQVSEKCEQSYILANTATYTDRQMCLCVCVQVYLLLILPLQM